jgi:hypothetical protein
VEHTCTVVRTRKKLSCHSGLSQYLDSYSVRQLPICEALQLPQVAGAWAGTCMRSLFRTALNSTEQLACVPWNSLFFNMFRLQMWLQFPAGVRCALCSSHFADRHRDASRRHHPTPATPFVCGLYRQLRLQAVLSALGPARVLVTNRHRG